MLVSTCLRGREDLLFYFAFKMKLDARIVCVCGNELGDSEVCFEFQVIAT